MRQLLLIVVSVLAFNAGLYAQRGLFVNDNAGGIRIMPNTSVYIDGDFQLLEAFPNPINKLINGTVTITGDLVTNDTLYCETADSIGGTLPARFIFVGNANSSVRGTASPQFYQLVFQKSGAAQVLIDTTIRVVDTITFVSGNAEILPGEAVNLVYRQGTNSVPANPWIAGETAAHRFTGEGTVQVKILVESGHPYNLANTGFHYAGHQGDSLLLIRGHQKQLYAGNGSVDRYFDVEFRDNDTPTPDSVTVSYIPDVDYVTMGVDTARLGLFISDQFQDIDYRRVIDAPVNNIPYSLSMLDVSQYDNPDVNVPAHKFRITAADTLCLNPPVSSLPDTLLHICAGDSLLVTATNTTSYSFPNSIGYLWQDQVLGPQRYFHPTGVQQDIRIKLYDSRGCYSIDTLHIAPAALPPGVDFDWDDACMNDSIAFYNETTVTPGETFSSSWIFGDGNTSATSDTAFAHFYNAPGTYTVSLTTVSNYGCSSDTTHDIKVFNLPVAAIEATIDCVLDNVFLDAGGSMGTTSPVNSALISWNWEVDATASSNAPSYYEFGLAPGNHTITLVVESGVHCRDTVTENLFVPLRDTAGFTVANGCAGSAITFNNVSYVPNANPQYFWEFSDLTTSAEFSPQKTFTTPGVYSASLTVTTDAGCDDVYSMSFTVYALPAPAFAATAACQGSAVTFQPSPVTGGTAYSWNYGDGNSASGTTTSHSYAADGTYTVQLTAVSSQGCTNSVSHPVTVYPLPVAAFSGTNVCIGAVTQFASTSSGTSLSYDWDFGDFSGGTTGPVISHQYLTSGNKSVQLEVTDNHGCQHSVTNNVTVYALPVIPLSDVSTCGAQYVLDAGNAGSEFNWAPGNDTTQTLLVTEDGAYSVTVTDIHGCQNTESATVTLNDEVQPDLGPDVSACGVLTLDAEYNGADYLWSDGSTDQTLTVTTPGTYWVSVTDQNGCQGSDTVVVTDIFVFTQPNAGPDLAVCTADFPVQLSAGAYADYEWNTSAGSQQISVSTPGLYWVEVTDANGCSGRDSVVVTSLAMPVSVLENSVTECDEAVLVASGNASDEALWSTAEETNEITVTASGQYTVTITGANGCSINDTSNVTIVGSPVVDLGPNQSVCSNAPVTLSAGNPGSTYEWHSTSGALLSTAQSYTPLSSGTYIVTVSNTGCSAQGSITITMLPSPVIPVQPATFYICGTTPVVLEGCAFGTNQWTSTSGFSSTDAAVNVSETGTYTVQSFVGACTTSRSFELITSPQQIQAFYLVDSDTTKNLAIKFIDLSEPEPISYLWDFGDGMTDTVPDPVHTYSIAQIYHTSLTVSNGFCVSKFTKDINQKTFFPDDVKPAAPSLELVEVKVYPNPVTDELHFDAELSAKADCRIALYDMLGKLVYTEQLGIADSIHMTVPVTGYMNGAYFLRFEAESLKGNLLETFKLIKTL